MSSNDSSESEVVEVGDDQKIDEVRVQLAPLLATMKSRQEMSYEAASHLFAKGVHPSAAKVHRVTRRGSLTDINRDLKSFWAKVQEQSRVSVEIGNMPEPLRKRAGDLLGVIWLEACDAQAQEYAKYRAQADEQVASAVGDLEAERIAKRLMDEENSRLREEIKEVRASLAGQADELSSALERCENYVSLYERVKGDLKLEGEARQRAEERFSADLAALKDFQARELEYLEGQKNFAIVQVDQARTSERALREELKNVRDDAELQIRTMRIQANNSREEAAKSREESDALRQQLDSVNAEITRLRSDLAKIPSSPSLVRKQRNRPAALASSAGVLFRRKKVKS